MNRREFILLLFVIVALVFGLSGEDTGGSWLDSVGLGSTQLDGERRRFNENYELLKEGPEIRLKSKSINTTESTGSSQPGTIFYNEVSRLITEKGRNIRGIETPGRGIDIDGVKDYYFLPMEYSDNGKLSDILDLMMHFTQNGIQIQTFTIEKSSPNINANLDLVKFQATLVSLVKRADGSTRYIRGR